MFKIECQTIHKNWFFWNHRENKWILGRDDDDGTGTEFSTIEDATHELCCALWPTGSVPLLIEPRVEILTIVE